MVGRSSEPGLIEGIKLGLPPAVEVGLGLLAETGGWGGMLPSIVSRIRLLSRLSL